MPNRNIVLIGVMGCGKSTVAPILGAKLKRNWCDTDTLIEENKGVSGARIIEQCGIDVFRSIEEEVVLAAFSVGGRVIATGAGAWTIRSVRECCARTGVSVWMKVEFATLVSRVANSDRFLIRSRRPEAVILDQLSSRLSLYAQADYTIGCEGLSADETAEAISVLLAPVVLNGQK